MDARWWRAEKGEAHSALVPIGKSLWAADHDRRAGLRYYRSLYEETDPTTSWSIYSTRRRSHHRHERRDRNLVRPVVDAAHAIAVQSPTKVMFLTDEGSQRLQTQAAARQKLMDREFARTKYGKAKSKALLHAIVYGTGILRPHRHISSKRPAVEVVDPWNLFVDDLDAAGGDPRCYYERLLIDRWVLLEAFGCDDPKKATDEEKARTFAIKNATRVVAQEGAYSKGDRIEVWQAYHLPSGPDATDGRHVVAIDGVTLVDRPYEHEDRPYVIVYWREPIDGFWGYGIPEILASTQEAMTRNEEAIEAAQFVHGHARMWAQRGSVDPKLISNQPGKINFWDPMPKGVVGPPAGPPQLIAGSILSPEIYKDRDALEQFAYTLSQVSQNTVTNQRRAGVVSGRAIRLETDLDTRPLVVFLRSCEQADVETSRRYLRIVRDLQEESGSYISTFAGGKPIDLGDLGDDGDFDIQPFPVSAFSTSPAGRLEDAQELVSSKLADYLGMGPAEILSMLQIPDTKAHTSLLTAPFELVRKKLEKILLDGEDQTPTPEMDLTLSLKLGALYLNKAELCDDVEEERLEMLRVWIANVKRLKAIEAGAQAAEQAAAQAAMAPPDGAPPPMPPGAGPPPGGGEPMPVSLPPELQPAAAPPALAAA
jgi:hypothetical protein